MTILVDKYSIVNTLYLIYINYLYNVDKVIVIDSNKVLITQIFKFICFLFDNKVTRYSTRLINNKVKNEIISLYLYEQYTKQINVRSCSDLYYAKKYSTGELLNKNSASRIKAVLNTIDDTSVILLTTLHYIDMLNDKRIVKVYQTLNMQSFKSLIKYFFRSIRTRLISSPVYQVRWGTHEYNKPVFNDYSIITDSFKSCNYYLKNQLNHLTYKSNNEFINEASYWYNLFKKNNTRFFLFWNKYSERIIAQTYALKRLKSVSLIWQFAFDGKPNFNCSYICDVSFGCNRVSYNIDCANNSQFSSYIITGWINSFNQDAVNNYKSYYRKKLNKDFIISVFDENSMDDDRWHTGHALQIENYHEIIKYAEKHPSTGILFKPKSPKTLKARFGKDYDIIHNAINKGLCFIVDDTEFNGLVPPKLLALSSDLCIHGHLCAGTAGIESLLTGVPTMFVNREGVFNHYLNKLEKFNLVYNDWQTLTESLSQTEIRHLKALILTEEFKNSILSELDPFHDYNGSERMRFYLDTMVSQSDKYTPFEKTQRATDIYEKTYGEEFVVRS